MRVSRRWIEWAHGPVVEREDAEELVPASLRLMELASAPGRGAVEVEDPSLLRELLSVAECYGPGSVTDEMGPWWKGEQARVVREARAALRKRRRDTGVECPQATRGRL
jgi:hypothetical protein